MRIRQIEILNFRGIRELHWKLPGAVVCLMGAGDSTKTTILDAVELALLPRWTAQFSDADFYLSDTAAPVEIKVTIGDLPDEFKSELKFGYMARGWTNDDNLRDEPEDGDELALTIRLRVDASLEPVWAVVNDREPDGKYISARDRERLGCVRVGEYLDRHFTWGRGSALAHLTSDTESLPGVLSAAGRAARHAWKELPAEEKKALELAVARAAKVGGELGVARNDEYTSQLDPQTVSLGLGALSLHDGDVPIRNAGLGTRRLLAIAMQRERSVDTGLTLVDELEHGLEPHRLRRLARVIAGKADPPVERHVLLTTHSATVIHEMGTANVAVVRSNNGRTQVVSVPDDLHTTLLRNSDAFLARKVIVCEGKTELGLLRRFDEWWAGSDGEPFSLRGVALADGGGNEAPLTAERFASLGYGVLLLVDSDRPLNPDKATLEDQGVSVLAWGGSTATEQRVFLDVPWSALIELLESRIAETSYESVCKSVAARASVDPALFGDTVGAWPTSGLSEEQLRAAVGNTAKDQGWYKRVDLAVELAQTLIACWHELDGTDLKSTITAVREWNK